MNNSYLFVEILSARQFGDCALANGHGQVSFFENQIQSAFYEI